MDFKKFLEGLGFSAEDIKKIMDKVEEENLNLILDGKDDPGWIPKKRFDEVNLKKKELENKVNDFEKIEKGYKADIEGYKDIEKSKKDLEGKFTKLKKETEVKLHAMKAGAYDVDDVLKFINFDDIEVNDDGVVTGVDAVIKDLVENKNYLFRSEDDDFSGGVGSGSNPGGSTDTQDSIGDILKDIYG